MRPNTSILSTGRLPFTESEIGAPSFAGVVIRPLADLRPNPKNARTHSKRKIRDLAKAIEAVGFIGVIVVDERE